ncbi:hypothetical protein SAMD00019534_121650 [Acytostelium subglobosum LB1]|uniref:hypothetical protein n=1 Tax=Acytostelium subglobosum LB1 TaxID=1410327 RepID=UPI000644A288|nr:hypothetical protein SAMD00019534_121650 [Acytostelium subglobosum LB1]GAM28989.1 hypothetical protein SAMD00019534_121650 [Acytostelium subglobosum LB1]|eukprot:XP_012747995.1 hypothetical protein SAMD00019534_121650 [Acytostelium subglobosum LB1]
MQTETNAHIHVLLVATYGDVETDKVTPLEFKTENTLGLADLLLTQSEFLELVNKDPNKVSGVTIEGDALEYFWKITRGHVGIIRFALHDLDKYAADTRSKLASDDIIHFFISLRFNEKIAKTRAVPKHQYNEIEMKIIKNILMANQPPLKIYFSSLEEKDHLEYLIKIGVLVDMVLDSNKNRCIYFASPILRGIYFTMIFGAPSVDCNAQMDNLGEFVKSVLQLIDHNAIKTTLSKGNHGTAMEDFWQHELYHAARTIMPSNHNIFPVVGHDEYFGPIKVNNNNNNSSSSSGGGGSGSGSGNNNNDTCMDLEEAPKIESRQKKRLRSLPQSDTQKSTDALGMMDFFINTGLDWGIELTREGNAISEHLNRFNEGGLYHHFKNKL